MTGFDFDTSVGRRVDDLLGVAPAPARRSRRWWLWVLAAVLVLVLVITVAVLWSKRVPHVVATPGVPDTVRNIAYSLEVAPETREPRYSRDAFEHWIDADRDGCNTRYEVLIRESLTPVAVTGRCWLEGGSWQSAYDDLIATEPGEISIDHVVALAEAWRSGAAAWTDAERAAFANDLDAPYTLVVASHASNERKADKDPARWLPPTDTCAYVTDWVMIKSRWGLAVDSAEQTAILAALRGSCGDAVVETPALAR